MKVVDFGEMNILCIVIRYIANTKMVLKYAIMNKIRS